MTQETKANGPISSERLEALLKEHDAAASAAASAPAAAVGLKDLDPSLVAILSPIIGFVEQQRRQAEQAEMETAINAAVARLHGLPGMKDVPEGFTRGYLEYFAIKNKAFAEAFGNRSKDSEAWGRALNEATAAFEGDIKKFPAMTTQTKTDVAAAVAAVQGTAGETAPSPKLPPQSELNSMSDAAFRTLKEGLAAEARS